MNWQDTKNQLKYIITEDIPNFIKIEIIESLIKETKKLFKSSPRIILFSLFIFLIFFNNKGDTLYATLFFGLIILFFLSWRYSIGEFRYIARERRKKKLLGEANHQ